MRLNFREGVVPGVSGYAGCGLNYAAAKLDLGNDWIPSR
jgi:hypothetical protein